jgi:hypothetical protein
LRAADGGAQARAAGTDDHHVERVVDDRVRRAVRLRGGDAISGDVFLQHRATLS